MSLEKPDHLPIISPRFGGGQVKGSVTDQVKGVESVKIIASGTTSISSSSFFHVDEGEGEVKLPAIGSSDCQLLAQNVLSMNIQSQNVSNPKLISVHRSMSIESVVDTAEEVDTFTFDDLAQMKSTPVVSGSASTASFFSSPSSGTSSSRYSPSKKIWAKAS
jgi:hypothetical protein